MIRHAVLKIALTASTVVLSLATADIACCQETTRSAVDSKSTTQRRTLPSVPSQETAWANLPNADRGKDTPLPTWARTLSASLPYTTAAVLELEQIYRTEPFADTVPVSNDSTKESWAVLVSVARLAVADFHESAYGRKVALSDLERAGVRDVAIRYADAKAVSQKGTALQNEVYAFATQLAKAGREITDDQFMSLHRKLGDDRMVGLVLQIAHGCYQDRLLLALGIADIADANAIPVEIHFVDSTPTGANTPNRPRIDAPELLESVQRDILLEKQEVAPERTTASVLETTDAWYGIDYQGLQKLLGKQRERTPRVPVPEWEEIVKRLPEGLYRRPLGIRWSRLVVGRQPRLGPAWIKCLRTFEQEASQNRVFEESVFWVVTRSLKCLYCMGHCEMLMEVGGLGPKGIANRTERIAGGNWSSFSKQEQAAFRFAKKLTEVPLTMNVGDMDRLLEVFSNERTLDLVWWTARCQFMTKVSDAFQLQLERENVFAD